MKKCLLLLFILPLAACKTETRVIRDDTIERRLMNSTNGQAMITRGDQRIRSGLDQPKARQNDANRLLFGGASNSGGQQLDWHTNFKR